MKMSRIFSTIIVSILFCISAIGQKTIDLNKNKNDNNIIIKGTYLSIDTSGLNLRESPSPRVFINEKDHTVFAIEQKEISLDNYESVIGKMLKLDTVFTEKKVVFNEFSGKMIVGKVNIENIDQEFWWFYLGNKDVIIEIKGYYKLKLKSKYNSLFEKALKSVFIDTKRKMSIYEDLPFYLDEIKFPYKKEVSFMPQSIFISKDIDGNRRSVSMSYIKSNKEDIENYKSEYVDDVEKIVIRGREIFTRIIETEDKITLEGIIVFKDHVINLNCFSSESDKEAINVFKEIAKSITFKL